MAKISPSVSARRIQLPAASALPAVQAPPVETVLHELPLTAQPTPADLMKMLKTINDNLAALSKAVDKANSRAYNIEKDLIMLTTTGTGMVWQIRQIVDAIYDYEFIIIDNL